MQAAQQIASLVNIARAALLGTDGINRIAIIKSVSTLESVKLTPREPSDKWEPYEVDRFQRVIERELRDQLGPDTIVASAMNGVPGLWVGFSIARDSFWLKVDPTRVGPMSTSTIVLWVSIALLATVLGSAGIARLINRPLKDLSFAASRIREGEYDSRLDETTMTSEIRQVNMGFNRMARELAKVEQDRAVMLAGISHDLRTPLSRLRLEAEMSVQDEEAKGNMAMDIDQLDAIIDKFMDYARPGEVKLVPVRRRDGRRARGGGVPRHEPDPHPVEGRARHQGPRRRRRARPGAAEPVRERAPLRPLDRHRHRPRRRQLRAHRAVGDHHRARPRPGRRPEEARPADDAVLSRRRGAHRGDRRRPRPGDRREGDGSGWAARSRWPTPPTAGCWPTSG